MYGARAIVEIVGRERAVHELVVGYPNAARMICGSRPWNTAGKTMTRRTGPPGWRGLLQ
ncbi:hypothetical protein [Streptomyces canus]|uniref:hypothetical protein n=1 Tax=Streptomyces canus TaxID=58343 RepID=UPI002E276466|nr:hypothetical protein OH824_15620 [Streptomyces canus]